jgi:hypothetical protein
VEVPISSATTGLGFTREVDPPPWVALESGLDAANGAPVDEEEPEEPRDTGAEIEEKEVEEKDAAG